MKKTIYISLFLLLAIITSSCSSVKNQVPYKGEIVDFKGSNYLDYVPLWTVNFTKEEILKTSPEVSNDLIFMAAETGKSVAEAKNKAEAKIKKEYYNMIETSFFKELENKELNLELLLESEEENTNTEEITEEELDSSEQEIDLSAYLNDEEFIINKKKELATFCANNTSTTGLTLLKDFWIEYKPSKQNQEDDLYEMYIVYTMSKNNFSRNINNGLNLIKSVIK